MCTMTLHHVSEFWQVLVHTPSGQPSHLSQARSALLFNQVSHAGIPYTYVCFMTRLCYQQGAKGLVVGICQHPHLCRNRALGEQSRCHPLRLALAPFKTVHKPHEIAGACEGCQATAGPSLHHCHYQSTRTNYPSAWQHLQKQKAESAE